MAVWGGLPATCLRADTAYSEDFSLGEASAYWAGTSLPVSQASGTNTAFYLGQLNNDAVTLALTGLDLEGGAATPNLQGQHSFVTVSYDLFVIGDWTGNNSSSDPHTFAFETSSSADATSHGLTTTFSNTPASFQTYPYDSLGGFMAQPGGKGANQINTLGFSGAASGYDDAVYQLAGGRNQSFTFYHGVDDLTLDFSAANLAPGATWGLTNLKVSTGGVFNWQAAPSIGDGLDGGWEIGEHWANPNFAMNDSPGPDDAAQFTAAGNYNVSIHQDTSVGFLLVSASTDNASAIQFNTIGHTLTLTAGNYSNVSLAIADGSDQSDSLFVFNSNNDLDSNFDGVINAETVGIARGVNTQGMLTLDGYLDPAQPGTSGGPLGNVILNVQREMSVGDGRYRDGGPTGEGTLNIQHGAILNSGLGGGSASSNPSDGNVVGGYSYVDGTVNVSDQGIWNQTGAIWVGVEGTGSLNVTGGSQVNLFQLPYAGQAPARGNTLDIGGWPGSNGSVTVKDPDSIINAGEVMVANLGVDASLAIDNFGGVNAASVSIGADIIGSPGSAGNALVNVTHQGQLNVTTPAGDGLLKVGDALDGRMTLGFVSGTDGSLFNTGRATADFAVLGNLAGVNGEVDVSYAQLADLHSLFTVNQTLTIGEAGQGTLFMNGGGVSVVLGQGLAPGMIVTVGNQAGSNGQIYAGGGSGVAGSWGQGSTFDASAGGVMLGNAGLGRLNLSIGGQAFAKTLIMSQQAGSSSELGIDGDGSDNVHTTLLKVSDPATGLTVGQAGTSASVTVFNGALLDTFRATVGGQGGDLGPGTVTVQDLRDPATLLNHEIGSLWLVHGLSFDGWSLGGTLDIGGAGIGNPLGGTGSVTIGSGGRLGVAIGLQLGKNGRLDLTGGAATVGTSDPLLMDATPSRLRIVGTSLPMASSTVYGQGVIAAEVLIDSGGNLGPNGFSGSETGVLSIIGSLHGLAGANLSTKITAPSTGNYDRFALLDATLSAPAGTAILNNGTGITVTGQGVYHNPQVGDYIDVLTAAKVIIGTLDLTFIGLPSSDWHYGVVSIPGGQALRIQYGAVVHEPGSLSIRGIVRFNGAPAANVVIGVEPGISALTDATGQYTLSVPTNSSGTVTPSASGFLFDPPLRTFTNLTANLSAQDFLMSGSITPTLVMTEEGPLRRVTWTGLDGVTYQPQESSNLVDWTELGSPLPGTNSPLSFTFATTPDPQHFFRVRAER